MPDYRYLIADTLTRGGRTELPVISSSYEDVLNSPGSCSLTIPLFLSTQQAKALTLERLQEGASSLFVERDGQIMWGGPLWTWSVSQDLTTITLNAEGFGSWPRRVLLRDTKDYTAWDQVSIATDLLAYAQAQPGGLAFDTSDVMPTGRIRDRNTYFGYERKFIGGIIEQLAAVDDGFDFRYEPLWVGEQIGVRFLTQYPSTGRDTDLVFESGANATLTGFTSDGTNLATRADATGAGQADLMLIQTWSRPDGESVPLLLDAVESFPSVTDTSTLLDKAKLRVSRGSQSVRIPTMTMNTDAAPLLGSYIVGDQVRARADHGLLSFDQQVRITGRKVTVDKDGLETVALTFAPVELFS